MFQMTKNGSSLDSLRGREKDKNKELVHDLEKSDAIQDKTENPLKNLNEKGEIPRGNACRSLGDCIIALESPGLEGGCVVTSNEAGYAPVCQKIGAQLVVIQ